MGDSRIVGVHHDGTWAGADQAVVEGETWTVRVCPSLLDVHDALAHHDGERRLVLVSPFERLELGVDIVSRLARQDVIRPRPLLAVLSLFGARDVDRRVARHDWMLDELLRLAPAEGYVKAEAGTLTYERAWEELLRRGLGLPGVRPSLVELVRWGVEPARATAFQEAPSELRAELAALLDDQPGADVVLAAVEHGVEGGSVIGGLVARLLDEQERAAGRLEERVLGGHPLRGAAAWAEAAERVAREHGEEGQARAWVAAASALADDLGIADRAGRSPVLPAGWTARLETLAAALDGEDASAVSTAGAAVLDHLESRAYPRLPAALAMLERLVRRRDDASPPRRLDEAVHMEVAEGGWTTWARAVAADAAVGPAAPAVGRLLTRIDAERAGWSRAFAALAVRWDGERSDGLLGVEHVLDAVVVPVASAARTLVVVVDGMSQAVARELLDGLLAGGWQERRPAALASRAAALATLPSLTAVSRSALLSGRLGVGEGQDAERKGFAGHAGLRECSAGGPPPHLLHQAALADDGSGLPTEVVEHVRSRRRILGVVVNAIDDSLGAGTQQRTRWTLDDIPVLRALLDIAAEADRAVVLLSDHGHVPERPGTAYLAPGASSSGARRRSADGEAPRDGEVLADGPRLVGADRVIMAADPHLRYVAKAAAGYHGGASPEELVAPVVVLVAGDQPLDGLVEQPADEPAWWRGGPPGALPAEAVRRPRSASRAGQLALEGVAPAAETGTGPAWLGSLLESQTLAAQRQRAGRASLDDQRLRAIVTTLTERGTLTKAALATQAGLPSARVDGILAVARQLLNVDGVPVLNVDPAADAVTLNVDALRAQFGI